MNLYIFHQVPTDVDVCSYVTSKLEEALSTRQSANANIHGGRAEKAVRLQRSIPLILKQ